MPVKSNMYKFFRWPNPARGEFSRPFGGIVEVLRQYSRFLPVFGWLEVAKEEDADLVVGHLGTETERLDVFHLHGLMPTAGASGSVQDHRSNATIIDNIRRAQRVVCVSDWVADLLRRDMHMSPDVVGHGFDWEVWQEVPPVSFKDDRPKAIWNKTRNWGVCDPQVVLELARRLPEMDFITTFLPQKYDPRKAPSNVKVTGLLSRWDAWGLTKAADIYLGTTLETFGVGALEAMASEVPVVGFQHGATPNVVGEVGLFVAPGDYDALAEKVREALERREELGKAGLQHVKDHYTWSRVVRRVATIYEEVLLREPTKPLVTVVVPCHNKAEFVAETIKSVLRQSFEDWELVVVNDASTDDSANVILGALEGVTRARLITHEENRGVAHARNTGIAAGSGEYVWCIDADDSCAPKYLETMVAGLQEDPRLAVVYTGITGMDAQGKLRSKVHTWPLPYDAAKGMGGNQIPTSCLYKRLWWERLGGYRQRYAPRGAGQEDADFWFRMLAAGGGARMVSEEGLFHYRFHEKQVTRVHRDDWKKNLFQGWQPFAKDGKHPFASQLAVPPRESWEVRNYDTPEVSVIVPVGPGHGEVLVEALDSIEAQTFRNWELYVVNDTGEELDLTAWPYARLINTEGSFGPSCARNLGVMASSAPTLVFLDADDYLEPTFLEETYKVWKADPDFWVYTDLILARADGSRALYSLHDWDLERLWKKGVASVTCLLSRKMWEAVGGFDENTPLHEDWDFHIRLALKGFCGQRVPQPLFTYRSHLGMRRTAGREQDGAKDIRNRYRREDVMGCGCRKQAPRKVLARTSRNRRPAVASDVIPPEPGRGWLDMEYTGPVKVDQAFRGRGGRRYLFGNNKHNRARPVHPEDVARLRRNVFLRMVGEE